MQEEYNKLVNECKLNGSHLNPDKGKNLCNHCFNTLILPKTETEKMHEFVLKERKTLPLSQVPYDAGYWHTKILEEKDFQKKSGEHNGLIRYIESLDG